MSDPEPNINRTINNTLPRSGAPRSVNEPPVEAQELKQHPDAPKLKGFILLRPIGQGVHAQVWEGIQVRTRRFCAIKVFRQDSGMNLEFLKKEVEKVLNLDKHPHIISLFDADFVSEPPFYVMDLAQNGSIEKLIKEGDPTALTSAALDQRVLWLEEIASALQYVHAKGIIHCDFKPANVLLDEDDHTRVADFGHSRVLNESGSALGTLFYMAPEQAYMPDEDNPLQPDVKWDIYAFGCTAYAILSGHVPHADIGMDLERTPVIVDRLKIYRKALANDPVMDLQTLTKGKVDRDLSAIIEKCMKTDPNQRYRSMAEILKDLQNRREGKPVSPLAHIPSYWIRKYAHRYRVTLVAILAAVLALMAATLMAHRHEQSQTVNRAFDDILRGREFLDKDDQASAVLFFAESNHIDPTALGRGDAELNMPPIPVEVLPQKSEIKGLGFSRDGQTLLTAGEKNGLKLWSLEGKELRTVKTRGEVRVFTLSPSNDLAAIGDSSGEVKLVNLKNGKLSSILSGASITAIAFSPDDKRMIVAGSDGTAQIFDTKTARPQHNVIKSGAPIVKALFNHEGRKVLTLSQEGIARVWEAEGANPQGDPMTIAFRGAPGWYTPDLAYSRDDRSIVMSDWEGYIHFFDHDGHRQSKLNLEGTGAHLCLDPVGRKLLTSIIVQGTGLARIWTLKDKKPSRFVIKQPGRILTLAFSKDGQRFLTAGSDRTARVWETATGKALVLPLWHGDSVALAALNDDGSLALTSSKDHYARLWDLNATTAGKTALLWKRSGHPSLKRSQTHALLSPDGKKLLTYGGGSALLWDTATGKVSGHLLGSVQTALFSTDGSKLFLSNNQQTRLVDLTSPNNHWTSNGAKTLVTNGTLLAGAGLDTTIYLWNVKDTKAPAQTLNCGFKPASISLSEKSDGLLALSASGALVYFALPVKNWDKPVVKIAKGVQAAALSRDNHRLAVLSKGVVKIYDPSNGKPSDKTVKQTHSISLIALSPDNKTLVTLDGNGTGQLWDLDSFSPVGSPLRHNGKARLVRFSPQGDGLAVGYVNDEIQFWDATNGEPIGVGISTDGAKGFDFRQDGGALVWLDKGGNLRTIDTTWLSSSDNPKRLMLQAQVGGQSTLTGHNSVDPMDPDDWYRAWKEFERR